MPPRTHDDLYVGYQKVAPKPSARFTRRVVGLLLAVAALVATAATFDQGPFSDAVFEFGVEREFEGFLVEAPFPVLRIDRSKPPADDPKVPDYLLVSFGKHGARPAVQGFAGHRVRLRGSLIQASQGAMIEVVGESITLLADGEVMADEPEGDPLGTMTLRGEIVDSKCFLGVMKPGQGKTHRSCASLCIRGGIPPALLVRGEPVAGARLLLLVDPKGQPLNDRVLDWVAQPIELTGQARRFGSLVVLATDPATFRHLPR